MPDPKLVRPWHGIPREQIVWHPTVDDDACIGCGTCVTGCGRLVYRFDFERKKAVIADPLNCLVGCTTCANTCPTHAISFPPLETIAELLERPEVHHAVEDELLMRKDQVAWQEALPHPDRLVRLVVTRKEPIGEKNLLVTLEPYGEEDCMCQFIPGQYLEIWVPGTPWMSRAYSIGSAPREDGRIELHLRRIEGGRFTTWAFAQLKVGDVLTVRGPLGHFVVRSSLDKPLLFVARGTGFAPIKAMIEQQLELTPARDLLLFWGVTDTSDFYELDLLSGWAKSDPNFRCVLTARTVSAGFVVPQGLEFRKGTCYDALEASRFEISKRDVYVAGPRKTVEATLRVLRAKGVPHEQILIDSYGN
ncbi:MAG: FAD-binding oxidoreductase [Candidatus Acetothermia bacterium]|jgi:CDP-4-dehydro-6-deoxyglucose reductase|nr:FAD-binding oxidoreductase [Candidatus Acetothermia bacterium]MDH7505484.1 FAD-binding oxidoreductase [Candidatus Acetothermia bacterium]